jgi:peptidoglycan/xylan/chitin deacetylase (PgdA/CDA1 family)
MLPAALSRYRIALLLSLPLCAWALWLRNGWLFSAVMLALLSLTALGVKIPQMGFFGPYVCRGASSRRCVALTFDDGPDPRSTPALLDLLRDAKVPATFFCTGQQVAAHPELAARIAREGHLIQNHSYTHNHATNIFTVARLRAELTQTQAVIQKITGVAPRWFRPPMGLTNPRVFHVARALGLIVVGWTARGFDTKLTEPTLIVARILRKLRPGAILLLHDGNIPAERLTKTVRLLLAELRARDYEVARLDHVVR